MTQQLGCVEVHEQDVLRFDQGLPGFLELKDFVLCGGEGCEPFKYLLSVEQPKISFLLLPPELVDSRYQVRMNEEARAALRWEDPHSLVTYAIVTLSSRPEETTANLLAPILIDATSMRGYQMIQDSAGYPLRCRLVDTAAAAL